MSWSIAVGYDSGGPDELLPLKPEYEFAAEHRERVLLRGAGAPADEKDPPASAEGRH